MRQWWWEFTRRRPDYRNCWLVSQLSDDPEYRFPDDPDALRLMFQLSVVHDPALQFSDRTLSVIRYPLTWGGPPGMIDKEMLLIHNRKEHLANEKGLYSYRFDLTQPLAPQFEKAKRLLLEIQSELHPEVVTRRPRTANFPMFLQALDARDGGATYKEMRDIFWPNRAVRKDGKEEKTEQSARDVCEAAIQLRDNFPL